MRGGAPEVDEFGERACAGVAADGLLCTFAQYSPQFPSGPTGPVPTFYTGTPRDVPMFAPGIMTAQGEVSAAVEKGGEESPCSPTPWLVCPNHPAGQRSRNPLRAT